MFILSHPYQNKHDLLKMQAFTAQMTAEYGSCGMVHVGDIAHRIFNGMSMTNPTDIVRLWEDDTGELIAWVISQPRFTGYDRLIHPKYFDTKIEAEIIAWAEQTTRSQTSHFEQVHNYGVDAFDCDTRWIGYLENRGYTRNPDNMFYTTRSLETIPQPKLPEGFTIRPTTGIDEVEKLVEVHNGSFGRGWSVEEYTNVMLSDGYATGTEMVVEAPNGRFAAFLMYWSDPINRCGLFEPVGAHRDFRRMGLSSALMIHTMHRMWDEGLETAIVWHEGDNEAATALYASLGFERKYIVYGYHMPAIE